MKKFISFLAISSLLFTACNNTNDDVDSNTQIKLTSSTEVKVNSGSAMAFITYDILEMVVGAEVKAEADVDWIINFDYKQQGKIQFNVEKNPDAEKREGNITITYDKSTLNVKVIQALSENPTNKEIKSPLLQGQYYGSYSGSNGLHNYYLVFTDLGIDESNNFYTPNAYYYFVDLYLDVEPNDMSHIQVPVGVYEFDVNNTPAANLFKDQFSWYQVNDDNGLDTCQTHYESGKLTVEEDKVTLEITLQIDYVQENHKVVYEGDYSLLDCRNEAY